MPLSRKEANLRIINYNICSVRNKTDRLNIFLRSIQYPEVVCLTEARLSQEEALVIKIDRYYLASCYCRTTCVGGGVAILVRDDLKFVEKKLNSINRADQLFEAVSVSICLDKNWINVSCVYRTPMANDDYFLNCLENLLHHTRDSKGPIFVCGDFNYNSFKF